ncbi:MAG: ABC transporter permease [Anaerolineae bacterium]|nr:ABC transporter permease [Anaerolineae bacterium]
MNGQMIGALLRKDLVLFFSNRFFALVTVLALVFYAVIYYAMPGTVDETLEMAIYAPNLPPGFFSELEEGGVQLIPMADAAALRQAIQSGEQQLGVLLSPTFAQNLHLGQPETIHLYFAPDLPDEFKELYTLFFREISFMLTGRPLNVTVESEILGVDRGGEQIPYRDRMLPLFAVLILMIETMGLASLITNEVTSGTITALLVTPLRVEGLFAAKGIFGVTLAFSQAAFVMGVTGGLNEQPILILFLLLLGSLLVTGIAFLIASVAKDMMSVMGWGMLAVLVMSLPAFMVLIPGVATQWAKILPSYYLVDGVYQVLNGGWGWGEVGQHLLLLTGFAAAFLGLGVLILRRRFQG